VPALALALYLVWALLAFGMRTWVQLRRTGDTGFRGVRGDPGSVEWWAGALFVLALLIGVAAPVVGILDVEPLDGFDSTAVHVAGVVATVVGIVLTLIAQLSMGDSWRVGVDHNERTVLVTSGPFTFVRNPIYSAMSVTAIGFALLVGNWLALVGLVVLATALELQVRVVEEPYLLAVHGDAYRSYATRVGRFVPGFGRSLDT
jgi:protein-S-isoprenylcysteine O-methyltransferase Ste14